MSKKKLTINIEKTADDCYIAVIVELRWTVLAESLGELFEAIPEAIEVYEEQAAKKLVLV